MIDYLAEYLVNIGCIQINARLSPDPQQQLFINERFLFRHDVERSTYHRLCEFPVTVDMKRMNNEHHPEGDIYRLPVLPKYKRKTRLQTRSLDDLESRNYAQELQEWGWVGCFCPKCDTSLVISPTVLSTCHNLPSEYWHELTDCWLCHEDHITQFGAKLDPATMVPKRGQCLVGLIYIVFHRDDVAVDGLMTQNDDDVTRKGRLRNIYCRKDGHWLGQGRYDENQGRWEWLRFYKYQIKGVGSPKKMVVYPFSFLRVFVDELIRMTQLHACYHFILADYHDTSKMYLYVSRNPIISRLCL
jgi:hypothetical protein